MLKRILDSLGLQNYPFLGHFPRHPQGLYTPHHWQLWWEQGATASMPSKTIHWNGATTHPRSSPLPPSLPSSWPQTHSLLFSNLAKHSILMFCPQHHPPLSLCHQCNPLGGLHQALSLVPADAETRRPWDPGVASDPLEVFADWIT